ncbi:MAG: trypsin-like serine protease [Candidatus Nitrosotenuis sp.]
MTTKIFKAILFASLVVAMILPFNMMDASAGTTGNATEKTGKTTIRHDSRESEIPGWVARDDLLKKLDTLADNTERDYTQKQIDALTAQIQNWLDNRMDTSKKELADKKSEILVNAHMNMIKTLGQKATQEQLPLGGIGYDYVNNALEIAIQPDLFTDENIPKYEKTIRQIIGNEIDITFTKAQIVHLQSCTDRNTTECEPIQGGVLFDVDNGLPCTVGYKATYNSKIGFVTAGHCVNGGGSSTQINQPTASTADIANVVSETYTPFATNSCDCAFLEENSPNRSMGNQVFGMVNPVTTANPFVNMQVTMSGGKSGLRTAFVSNADYQLAVDLDSNGIADTWFTHTVVAPYLSQSGDSGSPVMSGNSLIGIHFADADSLQAGDRYFIKASTITSTFSGLTWGF